MMVEARFRFKASPTERHRQHECEDDRNGTGQQPSREGGSRLLGELTRMLLGVLLMAILGLFVPSRRSGRHIPAN